MKTNMFFLFFIIFIYFNVQSIFHDFVTAMHLSLSTPHTRVQLGKGYGKDINLIPLYTLLWLKLCDYPSKLWIPLTPRITTILLYLSVPWEAEIQPSLWVKDMGWRCANGNITVFFLTMNTFARNLKSNVRETFDCVGNMNCLCFLPWQNSTSNIIQHPTLFLNNNNQSKYNVNFYLQATKILNLWLSVRSHHRMSSVNIFLTEVTSNKRHLMFWY